MWKVYKSQIPETQTVQQYIREHTDFLQVRDIKPKLDVQNNMLEISGLQFDWEALGDSIEESFWRYGSGNEKGYRFVSHDNPTGQPTESTSYTCLSIVHNPNHIENLPQNYSTLGTRMMKGDRYYRGGKRHENDTAVMPEILKDSYYDSWSFTEVTEAANNGALKDLSNECLNRSLIRGRIGKIDSKPVDRNHGECHIDDGWHKDEHLLENTRIMIPLITSNNFCLQIKDNPKDYKFELGNAYVMDTHIPHRVIPLDENAREYRIHIIYGTNPWFDYNKEEDSWTSNEFYGKMHPFDMIAAGYYFKQPITTRII